MSVKKILMLTAAAGFALSATAVLAGGPDEMAACDVHAFQSGAYVGANVGYGSSNVTFQQGTAGQVTVGPSGWVYGLNGGYLAVLSRDWSVAGDAFFNFTNIGMQHHSLANTSNVSSDYYMGIVVEPGYNLASNFRFYGRGGWTNMRVGTGVPFTKQNRNGYLAGLGSEIMVHPNAGIVMNFDHLGFGSLPVNTVTYKASYNVYTLGFDWHFV